MSLVKAREKRAMEDMFPGHQSASTPLRSEIATSNNSVKELTSQHMKHDEKVQRILKSNLSLGHKFQDILEAHGMENKQARKAARAITAAVEQHLTMLGNTFIEIGHEECGRALWLEAKSLLNT